MSKKSRGILKIIFKKGLLEFLVYAAKLFSDHALSLVKIFVLNMRGYDIHFSVLLRGSDFFFQSTKHAIKISRGSIIGKGNRISAGGDGKVTIGKNVLIDDSTYVMAHESIDIKDNAKIAAFCFICDFNHKFQDAKLPVVDQGYNTKPVVIGRNVWIGTHSVILPGVVIGSGSVIGAGSVVTKNIPEDSVFAGNPARFVKKISRK
jgi:acetyltransferase-like isoleucine patch superfamily enzyme